MAMYDDDCDTICVLQFNKNEFIITFFHCLLSIPTAYPSIAYSTLNNSISSWPLRTIILSNNRVLPFYCLLPISTYHPLLLQKQLILVFLTISIHLPFRTKSVVSPQLTYLPYFPYCWRLISTYHTSIASRRPTSFPDNFDPSSFPTPFQSPAEVSSRLFY